MAACALYAPARLHTRGQHAFFAKSAGLRREFLDALVIDKLPSQSELTLVEPMIVKKAKYQCI
jgi:hypothetical protein